MKRILVPVLFCAVAFAQNPQKKLSFEAAAIRPSAPGGPTFYNVDDANAFGSGMSIHSLIALAFGLPEDRIVQPGWTLEARFDIQAKLPAGATSRQAPEMLRSLLEERFGLRSHQEQRMLSVYELTVAPGGPKLKESTGDGDNPPGCNGGFHKVCGGVTMEQFTETLSRSGQMAATYGVPGPPGAPDRPVINATGLTAKYDFVYEAGRVGGGGRSARGQGSGVPPPDADVITAAEGVKALGLRLEPAKHMFDIVIVDRLERAPTEN